MAKKLFVEVLEARDLLPKDGTGRSSPYVVVDFDGQRRRTQTVCRNLNPVWNEVLEFDVTADAQIAGELLEADVLHDRRVRPSRRNNFLGRVRLDSRHFVRKGEEALIHFPLEKKNFFSWVRGDIGLRIYYDYVPVSPPTEEKGKTDDEAAVPPPEATPNAEKAEAVALPPPAQEQAPVDQAKLETEEPKAEADQPPEQEHGNEAEKTNEAPAEEQKLEASSTPTQPAVEEAGPKMVPQMEARHLPLPGLIERSSYDLVDKMHYLFVRIFRARTLPKNAKPHVRIAAYGIQVATRPSAFLEWGQTFAFSRDPAAVDSSNLEISVWAAAVDDGAENHWFLGGVCFDVSEVPMRDPPDSPLAPQWYRLEGGATHCGDLMLATWFGTQADESFADAWKAGALQTSCSKIYLSPKLWYLRATVIEGQTTTREFPLSLFVRATLGFQVLKTRASSSRNGSPTWNEDLFFVVAEPFSEEESIVLSLESKHGKDAAFLGSAAVPLSTVERRVDDRKVASRWLELAPSTTSSRLRYVGRLHVRLCLDGGYHVQDEPMHAISDHRPSARQLWQPTVGSLELGIIGCRGLLPMKTVDGKGLTDAFVVAKYGPKWARTRTVADSFDPAWNEQFNWTIFDPCTVLTLAVFDDASPGEAKSSGPCRPMGRIRIRISTLETNHAYRCIYPLFLLLPSGLKRMGEIEIAVRFMKSVSPLDLLHVYSQPMLPAMHHLRPLGSSQREAMRIAAARIAATHLGRTEPSLRREVVMWMLEAAEPSFSMRRVRANWLRIVAALSWFGDGIQWVSEIRTWRNPTTTVMAHGVAVILVWYPELIVPAAAVHLGMVGVWRYRLRQRVPAAGPAMRESGAEGADREELDEEFDASPSTRSDETVRARYERARVVGLRMQVMLGDAAAQAERVKALVSWRDPRATALFVVGCFMVAMLAYVVPARLMAVAAVFYGLRHPVFRGRMPSPAINFFRRLPSLADRII
ncbi:hypothetical protein HPP92_018976 [Vanilla planifolia]|uniref:C2 domain-containing protein n=1 Tax=Vanilla planifolia TaxID=51239 RepID=A0A835UL79_VANPL|nr:hypothetical protein HPP92_019535 [Vanilla planifolia]KAG0464812.1 hypothetical protein HPP92_018976 [Vanilla planifolia]